MNAESAEFIVHQESDKKWVWHLVLATGETIAGSDKGYRTEDECIAAIEGVKNYAATAKIVKK
jgi:uncharacterized protein YegP (UPF0339 family)